MFTVTSKLTLGHQHHVKSDILKPEIAFENCHLIHVLEYYYIQDIYFPVPLFVHLVYIYIDKLWKWGSRITTVRLSS